MAGDRKDVSLPRDTHDREHVRWEGLRILGPNISHLAVRVWFGTWDRYKEVNFGRTLCIVCLRIYS
jgi:hypothetical protein